jgi:hypothetical protein
MITITGHDAVGVVSLIWRGTDEIVEALTSPDDRDCPHCELGLLEGGPLIYPGCGAPY